MHTIYRAFIVQYSRSLHMEYMNTGIDILVITPFYFVSNKYRKDKGTLFAPMPIELVKGGFQQLGKVGLWQAHGYWVHGIVGKFQEINPLAPYNGLKRVEAHRASYKKKKEKKEREERENVDKDKKQ